jgi:hypothetical protein
MKGITMKKEKHNSQYYDRKHEQDHIVHNPRALKDIPNSEDSEAEDTDSTTTDSGQKSADMISKGHSVPNNPSLKSAFPEDKRKEVRQEHTNHFTSREGNPEKK